MDDDETKNPPGILGNLAAQPGGLLGGLFPPQPHYDPQQPGALPFGADPNAISLAAAESAAELARTLRNIDHQAAIMAAFGKAMGAPGTRSADPAAQAAAMGAAAPAEAPVAPSPVPVLARQRAPARVAPAAPVGPDTPFMRNPVPLPMAKVPQWPIPGTVEQRWAAPGAEIPDTSTLLQGIADAPLPTQPLAENPDWSSLPHGIVNVSPFGLPQPDLENPDTRALLQNSSAVPSPPKLRLPVLERNHIDPDELTRRIVRAESSGNPNAKSPTSSATGLAQFTDKTWLDQIKRYRPDLVAWRPSDEALLKLRTDPSLQREMAARYTEENARALDRAKFPVNDRNLYLAHHFGAGGAKSLLTAEIDDPNKLASEVIPWAMKDNAWITPTMTVPDVLQWIQNRIEHGP